MLLYKLQIYGKNIKNYPDNLELSNTAEDRRSLIYNLWVKFLVLQTVVYHMI